MKIKQAQYVRDFQINLLFRDGIEKVVDFKPFISSKRKLVTPLTDLEYFKNFYLDEITICWPNGLDFSPEVLYESGKVIKSKQSPLRNRRKVKNLGTAKV